MAKSPLTRWDEQRKEYGRVSQAAEQIQYWCQRIEDIAMWISYVPEFDTNMEDSLRLSIKKLEYVLRELHDKRNKRNADKDLRLSEGLEKQSGVDN